MFDLLIKSKGLKLNITIDENLINKKIIIDSQRLKQILVNLINNSFKFTYFG